MVTGISKRMSYFPFEIGTFSDRRVRELARGFGACGALVYIMLLCAVFGDERVFVTELDDSVVATVAEFCSASGEEVSAICVAAVECDLFDKGIFERFGILTSRQIQEHFQEMAKPRCSDTKISVDADIWLLAPSETRDYIQVVGTRDYKINKKENKEKENIVKEKESGATTDDELTQIVSNIERYIGKVSATAVRGIEDLLARGAEPELVVNVARYAYETGKGSWRYLKAAVLGNLEDGIFTAEEYERSRRHRGVTLRRPRGLCNYRDTAQPDYKGFEEKILEELLKEGENDDKG